MSSVYTVFPGDDISALTDRSMYLDFGTYSTPEYCDLYAYLHTMLYNSNMVLIYTSMFSIQNDKKFNEVVKQLRETGAKYAANVLKTLSSNLQNAHPFARNAIVQRVVDDMNKINEVCSASTIFESAKYNLEAFNNALSSVAFQSTEGTQSAEECFHAMSIESATFDASKIMQLIMYYAFAVEPEKAVRACREFTKDKPNAAFSKAFPETLKTPAVPNLMSEMDELFTRITTLKAQLKMEVDEDKVFEITCELSICFAKLEAIAGK